MKKLYISLFTFLIITGVHAQLSILAIGSPEVIDFTGFAGAGFQPGGGAGMLNSDTWSATGFSDGDVDFGGTALTGDFARGSTMGLETTGGIYGVDILGNQGLMVQPTADDFTPGSFILKIKNVSGSDIGTLNVAYTIYVLNDQNRSSSFNLSYSADNISYTDVPAVDYVSPELADFSPVVVPEAATITGINIPNGELFYVRWTSNDVAGAGNRDEIAIDDIIVMGDLAVPVPLYTISPTDVTVNEGDLEGSFDVSLSESHDCTLHFGYDPDATATPGFDYGLFDFTLDFTAGGPTTQTVIYGLVDDLTAEGTEYGGILITSADGGCYAGADTAISITIEDNEIVTPPIASFTTIGATEDEAIGTITGTIELTESADCELQMYLDGATTMTAGLDYTFALPANFTFTAGGATSQDFDIPIIDDVISESDEMLLMNLTVISGTCAIGAIADFEINILDNDFGIIYPVYDIAEVTEEDADGVALSDGMLADLTGIVYGVNLWDGGLQFTLIDNTGGINVFSFDNTFGYTVTEGDEVEVKGIISQFNGLTEIEPDTLIFISSGNALKTPTDVSDLNEATESDLVRMDLNGYHVADPLQWLGDGSSFNLDITNDVNTYVIRVDDNTELATMAYTDIFWDGDFPNDGFFVTGIGSQYDTETPFTEGYELLPRYVTDFIVSYESSINQLDPSQISIYPNPTTSNLILSGKENIEWVEIINQLGETIQTISINNFEANIDVQNIPAGLYFMKIKTDTGIYSSNFIKE